MAKVWDSYDFKIAEHYLSALINGDESAFEQDDASNFQSFIEEATQDAKAAGFTIGHWATGEDESDDWGTCAVSGLFANRREVKLMVYKDE